MEPEDIPSSSHKEPNQDRVRGAADLSLVVVEEDRHLWGTCGDPQPFRGLRTTVGSYSQNEGRL